MSIPDLYRRLENLIRLGTVEDIDVSATPRPLIRIKSGELLSEWVPFFTSSAGDHKDNHAPTKGELCVMFSPGGEPSQAVVITGLFSDLFPAQEFPAGGRRLTFKDGCDIKYDPSSKTLTATLPDGGKLNATAPGGFKLVGDIDHTGTLRSSVDVIAAGVSLKNHPTSGVRAGGDNSGPPVATS